MSTFNPFGLKSVFNVEEAACAIVGVIDYKENRTAVSMMVTELEIAFPPIKKSALIDGYERPYTKEWTESAKITREQLLAWCERKGIRPPLLFPDDPPALPTPADPEIPSRTKGTLYELIAAMCKIYYGGIPSLDELQHDIAAKCSKEFDPDFLKETLDKAAKKLQNMV